MTLLTLDSVQSIFRNLNKMSRKIAHALQFSSDTVDQ